MPQEVEAISQLVAILGFDDIGMPTTIVVCTNSGVKESAEMIFTNYPQTDMIHLYDLQLKARPKARYIKEELHKL